jgi:hypothetical protein
MDTSLLYPWTKIGLVELNGLICFPYAPPDLAELAVAPPWLLSVATPLLPCGYHRDLWLRGYSAATRHLAENLATGCGAQSQMLRSAHGKAHCNSSLKSIKS